MSDDKVLICRGTAFIEVDCAWLRSGLAVTPHAGWGHKRAPDDTWTVTHIPTGFQIQRRALDKDEAIRLAESVLPLADWPTLTVPVIVGAIKAKAPWCVAVASAVEAIHEAGER